MSGGTSRGNGPGRRLAWTLAAAAIAIVGFQGPGWADSNSGAQGTKAGEARKDARQESKAQAEAAKAGSAAAQPIIRTIGNVRVAIDPTTQQVRPLTPMDPKALMEALDRNLTRDTEEFTPIQMPNGSWMVNLQDTFQEVVVAVKDKKGKVSVHCVNTKEAYDALMSQAGSGPEAKRNKAKVSPNGLEKE